MRTAVLTGLLLSAVSAWILGAQRSPVPSILTLPIGGGAVAIGDVNRDNAPDIVTTGPNAVAVYFGDGRGQFRQAPGSPFPAGDNPSDLSLDDFNEDGRLDVAVANHETDYLSLLLGEPTGFARPVHITVPSRPHPHGVAAGDFNRDRNLDLATESWGENTVLVLHGNGKAAFTGEPVRVAVGRVPYYKLRAADLNDDGADDLVTTNTDGSSVSVSCSNATGGLRPASEVAIGLSPFALAIGDVNGDRRLDLAVAHRSGSSANTTRDRLTVLIGAGDCTFRPNPESTTILGRSPTAVAIGDVDGDGIGDIAVANIASNDVSVFLGTRAGFRPASGSPFPTGTGPTAIALPDLNGDGKADLVTGNSGSHDLSVRFSPY